MQTFNGIDLDPRLRRDDALEDHLHLETNNRTLISPQAEGDESDESDDEGGDQNTWPPTMKGDNE